MECFLWLCVLVLLGLLAAYISLNNDSHRKKIDQLDRALQEGKLGRAKELDKALADWLMMLELPQLEEETKRLEAAHQLRTVLIEKLMRSRNPC